jgi:tripartite-type tricarboxylate transporter receptor subunit TctC
MLTRRKMMAGCAGSAIARVASSAEAQPAYPAKAITVVVPYPAGGTTDLLGRLVADQLKTGLGATVIVENRPGAGTTLGAGQVAKAQPDGHTLLRRPGI